jgi:hypothetical protein
MFPVLGIILVLMLGETSLSYGICVAVIREYFADATSDLGILFFLIMGCGVCFLTEGLCHIGGVPASFADHTLYI